MLILGIDTSSPVGAVALRDENGVAGQITTSVQMKHSEGLMPALDALLQRTGKTVRDVTAVACVSGPGSYTGLRVGIASAQGIAFAGKLPSFLYTSLETLAWSVPFAAHPVCPVLPARKGWLYAQIYRWNGGQPEAVTDELYVQPDDLVKYVQEPVIFFGPGLQPYDEPLRGILEADYLTLPSAFQNPRADILTDLACRDLLAGKALKPEQLLPHYLGPSQAEVNWKNRKA